MSNSHPQVSEQHEVTSTHETIVHIQDLKKAYTQGQSKVWALRGVDLEIKAGEFTAFMGPSGSGKTTLLNMIGALDRPSEGIVKINGRSLGEMSDTERAELRRNKVGFIFQSYNLLPVLTAYENAEFVLMVRGVPEAERKAKVMELLTAVGLGELAHRRPNELSGGQQQRVAIARAMAGEPALILADEPTANLDSQTGASLIALMRKLNQERGITFIFSTHDPQVIKAAKRVIRLVDGQIAADESKT